MFRDIFPLKNDSKDPEKRIDCGEPSLLELLTGKQKIAFDIKGEAVLKFELCFRLYQHQLQNYVQELEKEYPDVKFFVHENRLNVSMDIPYLCDTYPLTTELTSASYVHNQTWIAVRNATSIVDSIYSRILAMHIEKTALEGRSNGQQNLTQAAVGLTVSEE